MKTLLVTSQITYVPDNYQELFETVLKHAPETVAGLVLLNNVSLSLAKSVAGLSFLGCTGVTSHLLRNWLMLSLRRRETLFKAAGLPVLKASSMNDPHMIEYVKKNQIDLVVNLRTRCIYRKEILDAPRFGCINIHHGILPDYRGTLCDLYALSEGRGAGFTIHRMNEKIDAGTILHRQEVSPPGERNYLHYLKKTAAVEGQALARLLKEIARDNALPSGELNVSSQPIYTRNPNRPQITRMRKAGMIL